MSVDKDLKTLALLLIIVFLGCAGNIWLMDHLNGPRQIEIAKLRQKHATIHVNKYISDEVDETDKANWCAIPMEYDLTTTECGK